jgi:hypothetical protein
LGFRLAASYALAGLFLMFFATASIAGAPKHLQTTIIEAAKMAPRYSPTLALPTRRQKPKART